jgi:hypothetical protein
MALDMTSILKITVGRPTIGSAISQLQDLIKSIDDVDITTSIQEWKAQADPYGGYGGYGVSSRMKERFHPYPSFAFAKAKSTQETLIWFNKKCKTSFEIKSDISHPLEALNVTTCLSQMMEIVGANSVARYVKTSKKVVVTAVPKRRVKKLMTHHLKKQKPKQTDRSTCVAKFVLTEHSLAKTKKASPLWKKIYFGDYKRAVLFIGKFAGRVYMWFDAWLRAYSATLAKTGLLNYVVAKYSEDLETLPYTTLFLTLAASEFGKRKEFTLESQKQGGLNTHLQLLFDRVKEKEPIGLRFVAYMLPANEIWSQTPREYLEDIHETWSSWMQVLAIALEKQWSKGVSKCSRRQMRVPPGKHYQHATGKQVAKSGVNSSLWNVVADAWSNGTRNLRGLDLILGKPAKFWCKTLQLIANDQFAWGVSAEKKMDPNVEVFHELTRTILPWRVAHPNFKDSFDNALALQTLLACFRKDGYKRAVLCETGSKTKSIKSWIGIPSIRKADVKVHHDMICGCIVPPMSQEAYDWVTHVLKPFGATGWSGV